MSTCHDVLSDILEKQGTETTYTDTVCYGFVPEEKQEETKMTDDQRDIIVELIRNTIDYLHKQEVMLIQLAGTIEMEKEHPEPTPAEKIGVEERDFRKQLDENQYPFPWGRNLGKKPDEDKPGLTHIVS